MNQELINKISAWFKKEYTFSEEDFQNSIVEYLGESKFRMTNHETHEIKEISFPNIHNMTDFEEHKIIQEIAQNLENKINAICEDAETKHGFIYQNEIDNYLYNNPEYQALNRVYDSIVYGETDKTKRYAE